MSNQEHAREIDKWLKWAAVIGPVAGFIFGNCSGAVITYNSMKDQAIRITHLEGWKDTQDQFNQKTVAAIARLKALIRDSQP